MNQLQAMKMFVAVVERGGFARAAHALHLATATVSEHVANLERHVGVSLLNRTTRKVALTDDGATYYAVCKRVLDQLGEVELVLGRASDLPAGRLRVEVADGITRRLILPLLPEFQHRYPDITLHLVQSEHLFDLAQDGNDVIIRSLLEPPKDTRLIARPLGTTRVMFAAAPAYLKRCGTPATPYDLLQHHCIGFIDPLSNRLWEWFFDKDGERFSLDLPCALALSHGELREDAALRGLGIINDLYCHLGGALRRGQLVSILEPWSYHASLIHALYPRKRQASAKVTAFVDFLLEKYPPERELEPLD
jgi:DNA-binding transcriptional LysR family regulator